MCCGRDCFITEKDGKLFCPDCDLETELEIEGNGMLGGTTAGFCRREWDLWYGDGTDPGQCKLPLSDGKPCGDAGRDGTRCPYNKDCGLTVDMSNIKYTTYAYLNDPKAMPKCHIEAKS